MREYGPNRATEFTKKQIGVVYRLAKTGELKIEKWAISNFYDLAEYYGYDDNRNVERAEREILKVLDAVFVNDFEKAQKLIDRYTADTFELLSRKSQAKADRSFL